MATPSAGRGKPRAKRAGRATAKPANVSTELEEIATRAARLGVTPERVLLEYARIAFADLRHIVEWSEQGFHVRSGLSAEDAAPIAEIGGASATSGPTRVKLYDKKAALDAIGRYLGMFPAAARRQDEPADDAAEDAREELARLVARLAAGAGAA